MMMMMMWKHTVSSEHKKKVIDLPSLPPSSAQTHRMLRAVVSFDGVLFSVTLSLRCSAVIRLSCIYLTACCYFL